MSTTPGREPSHDVDWREIHAKLERVAAATREAVRLSPERARAVMDERARTLARVPPRPPSAAEVMEVATFLLGEERYAIETRYIRRVIRLEDYTPVPGAPEFLVGVINHRGEVLAVMDLHALLGLPDEDRTELTRIVVLGDERDEFGILTDAAHEVRTLRIDQVLDPPGSLEGAGRQYLRGVTEDALIVLDGEFLLRDERLVVNQGEDAGP